MQHGNKKKDEASFFKKILFFMSGNAEAYGSEIAEYSMDQV